MSQVSLLLEQLTGDVRGHVKVVCLRELKILAGKKPHLWTHKHIHVRALGYRSEY